MLSVLVLLSVVLSNFLCQAQLSVESKIFIPRMISLEQQTSQQQKQPLPLIGSHFVADNSQKRAKVAQSEQRSPVVEIMLRILDTIQLIPKKRSRRAVAAKSKKQSNPKPRMMIIGGNMLNSLDPDKAPFFFRGVEQPLMGSSLEQTMDSEEFYPSYDTESFEAVDCPPGYIAEDIECEDTPDPDRSDPDEQPNERLYDLLMKILRILDAQTLRDAERDRRIEQLRQLRAQSNSNKLNKA